VPGICILKTFFDIPRQRNPEKVQYLYNHTTGNYYSFFCLTLGKVAAKQIMLGIAWWDVEYTCDEETWNLEDGSTFVCGVW